MKIKRTTKMIGTTENGTKDAGNQKNVIMMMITGKIKTHIAEPPIDVRSVITEMTKETDTRGQDITMIEKGSGQSLMKITQRAHGMMEKRNLKRIIKLMIKVKKYKKILLRILKKCQKMRKKRKSKTTLF